MDYPVNFFKIAEIISRLFFLKIVIISNIIKSSILEVRFMEVYVDPDLCISCGTCIDICPEIYDWMMMAKLTLSRKRCLKSWRIVPGRGRKLSS